MKIARGMRLLIPIALITLWAVAAGAEVVRIEGASRKDISSVRTSIPSSLTRRRSGTT